MTGCHEMHETLSASRSADHGCIICASNTHYYFSKTYAAYPGAPFENELTVDYWRCEHCGFVISRTHQEMGCALWGDVNTSWHHWMENHGAAGTTNQPPYADQALALAILEKNQLFSLDDALDYAAGYGTLSKFLSKYFAKSLKIYDRYVHDEKAGLAYVSDKDIGRYQVVINSAMFEHVLSRHDLDSVNELVNDRGVFMLHTVVCEKIPKDPNWFYLEPIVHTAFHTNQSMSLLMKQWGYAASIYAPQAKSWFLFKDGHERLAELEKIVDELNREMQTKFFHYKPGFLDYWKGF